MLRAAMEGHVVGAELGVELGVDELAAATRVFPGLAVLVSLDRGEVIAVSLDLEADLGSGSDRATDLLDGYATEEIRQVLRDTAVTRTSRRLSEVPVDVGGGVERFVDLFVRPVRSPDDRSLVLVRIDDASNRVRAMRSELAAQTAAKRANERYRLLYEFNVQGVVVQSPSGELEDANPAAVRLLGAGSLEELRGRTSDDPRWGAVDEHGHPLPGDEHPSMVALRTGRAVLGTTMGLTDPRTGSIRWIRVSASPLFDDGGGISGVFTSLEDITQTRLMEQLAAELEQARHEAEIRAVEHSIDREREEVRTLQEAVMPDLGCPDSRIETAVCYLSATQTAPVGGDWFDVIQLPSGDACTLVVGDVAGHGVSAARTMIQLRHWARLLALSERTPAEALARLNQAVGFSLPNEMVTVLMARIDFTAGTVCWATAGHPPLVIGTDTGARALEHRRIGPPLGVTLDFTCDDQIDALEVGDLCVAYTDGLVERRGQVIDEGMQAVVDVVGESISRPVEEVCDAIVDALLPTREADDDACVVVVRRR
jgi:PAS domain S-box-containing protein